MLPTLAAIDWLNGFLVVLFLAVSVMMILIVLIQRPQGGGLSGAFGSGAGSGQTAFGARTGDALTIATIVIFTVFLGVAAALNYTIRPPAPAKPGSSVTAPANAPVSGAGDKQTEAPTAETPPAVTPEAKKPVDAPAETPLNPNPEPVAPQQTNAPAPQQTPPAPKP